MRSRPILVILLFVIGLFAFPHLTHAGIPFLGPIIQADWTVPNTVTGGTIQCALGWGAVITVINNVISLLLTLVIVFVAPLMIAYAGFLFVVNPVNAAGKEQAKKILTNTVVGIVIALAGWMIVDAIMVVLYNGKFGTWSSLITSGGAPTCLPQEGVGAGLNQATDGAGVSVVPSAVNCATSYASTLPGISVSSTGNCCDKTQSTCTSLDGMLSSTVQQILNVNNKCGAITVTGGTEVGHANENKTGTHESGSKVDIREDLISCIEKTGVTRVTNPSFGSKQVKDKWGNIYTWEGNHTDIYVKSAGVL